MRRRFSCCRETRRGFRLLRVGGAHGDRLAALRIHHCDRVPFGTLLNERDPSISGDHAGSWLLARRSVSSLRLEPSTCIVRTTQCPLFCCSAKATLEPSGNHAGVICWSEDRALAGERSCRRDRSRRARRSLPSASVSGTRSTCHRVTRPGHRPPTLSPRAGAPRRFVRRQRRARNPTERGAPASVGRPCGSKQVPDAGRKPGHVRPSRFDDEQARNSVTDRDPRRRRCLRWTPRRAVAISCSSFVVPALERACHITRRYSACHNKTLCQASPPRAELCHSLHQLVCPSSHRNAPQRTAKRQHHASNSFARQAPHTIYLLHLPSSTPCTLLSLLLVITSSTTLYQAESTRDLLRGRASAAAEASAGLRVSRNVVLLGLTSLFTDLSSEMVAAILPALPGLRPRPLAASVRRRRRPLPGRLRARAGRRRLCRRPLAPSQGGGRPRLRDLGRLQARLRRRGQRARLAQQHRRPRSNRQGDTHRAARRAHLAERAAARASRPPSASTARSTPRARCSARLPAFAHARAGAARLRRGVRGQLLRRAGRPEHPGPVCRTNHRPSCRTAGTWRRRLRERSRIRDALRTARRRDASRVLDRDRRARSRSSRSATGSSTSGIQRHLDFDERFLPLLVHGHRARLHAARRAGRAARRSARARSGVPGGLRAASAGLRVAARCRRSASRCCRSTCC